MRETCRQQGLTLIELIVTIIILSIALLGVALIVRMGSQESANTMLETRAIALGQAYLDEIMGKRFDENSAISGLNPCFGLAADATPPARPCSTTFGPDSGESGGFERDKFDDVDDYNGWVEGDGEPGEPIRDAEGDEREGYENFHVSISVSYAGTDDAWGPLSQTHAKHIVVTVTTRGANEQWQFSSYKGNY